MDAETINRDLDNLGTLLREKLSIRGKSFEVQLKKAGRWLPRRIHRAGQVLITAKARAAHPKLARLNAPDQVARAVAEIRKHLDGIDAEERRKTVLLHWLAGILFNLMVLIALVILLVYWQGLA